MNIDRIKNSTVVDSNGCWLWQKSCAGAGYGQLTENGKYWGAHRYAFACFNELKDSDVIRHTCHVRKCCNPEHIVAGTHKDNWYDSESTHTDATTKFRKTWIVNGIPYDTMRDAVTRTGLAMGTLNKYTVDGVFDEKAYIAGCKIARVTPRTLPS